MNAVVFVGPWRLCWLGSRALIGTRLASAPFWFAVTFLQWELGSSAQCPPSVSCWGAEDGDKTTDRWRCMLVVPRERAGATPPLVRGLAAFPSTRAWTRPHSGDMAYSSLPSWSTVLAGWRSSSQGRQERRIHGHFGRREESSVVWAWDDTIMLSAARKAVKAS